MDKVDAWSHFHARSIHVASLVRLPSHHIRFYSGMTQLEHFKICLSCIMHMSPKLASFKLLWSKWKGFVEKNLFSAISEMFERFWKDSF